MDSVKLLLDVNYGNYDYEWSSSIEMEIVGLFFLVMLGARAHCLAGGQKMTLWVLR
jgi:hypothetical protein